MFASDKAIYKVVYRGGSLPAAKTGDNLWLVFDTSNVKFLKDDAEILNIPASAITEVSYGRDVHRRVGTAIGLAFITPFGIGALAALSKSKKHYIGIIWTSGNEKGGLAMQSDKNDYRGVLAALEAVSEAIRKAKCVIGQVIRTSRFLPMPALNCQQRKSL